MNILFDINHPAHIHFFKNAIWILKSRGHRIIITARDKDVTIPLLRNYQFEFFQLTKARKGFGWLTIELLVKEAKLLPLFVRNKINVCASITGACCVHVAKLLGIPSLVFYDTEHATLQNKITIPFATRYFTPDYYWGESAKNQIRYPGIHPLAHLHPKYFSPRPDILKLLNVQKKEKFIIMRFVAWGASHDKGQKGMSLTLKRGLIKKLSNFSRIFIVSESSLEQEFERYRFNLPPERIHDALYYAFLFIGEGATMASECACLGTPAIYANSLKAGVIAEEEKYGLLYDLENENDILNKAMEIIQQKDKSLWLGRKEAFLSDKIDVTEFIVNNILEFDPNKNK